MTKQALIEIILPKLNNLGISYSLYEETDVSINCEFLDASWGSGNKRINYEASVYFDESTETVFMREFTKETGSGFSFGIDSESSFQSGTTLFRKVKSIQYGTDGKAYEYTLDLGAITKIFKETAKENGWKFKTVLKKEKALYPKGYVQMTNEPKETTTPPTPPPINEDFKASPPPPNNTVQNSPPPPLVFTNTTTQGNQYSQKNTGKIGVSILFWILFASLTILDLLLLIGGSGIIFFILAAAVLAVIFIFRNKILNSFVKTLLGFLLAIVITFVIFAITVV